VGGRAHTLRAGSTPGNSLPPVSRSRNGDGGVPGVSRDVGASPTLPAVARSSYLGVNSQDMVYVAVTGLGVWAICKLGDTWSGVSPNSCKRGTRAAGGQRADSACALLLRQFRDG